MNVTESWNGTNWTEVNDLNTARYGLASAGVDNTSALTYGGDTGPAVTGKTEEWNGTNWTEVADLNTARFDFVGSGTTTAALAIGGKDPSNTGATEEWSGSSTTTKTISTD